MHLHIWRQILIDTQMCVCVCVRVYTWPVLLTLSLSLSLYVYVFSLSLSLSMHYSMLRGFHDKCYIDRALHLNSRRLRHGDMARCISRAKMLLASAFF